MNSSICLLGIIDLIAGILLLMSIRNGSGIITSLQLLFGLGIIVKGVASFV